MRGCAWDGELNEEGEKGREGRGGVWVGRRGRGDISGFPLSQMAEVERRRLIRYTFLIVSAICRSFCSRCRLLSAAL